MIKFLFFLFLTCLLLAGTHRTNGYPLNANDEDPESEFDFCDRESDCRQGEFCFQNEALDKGICVNKIAKTVDSVLFDPMDVNIVNERPIALP